MTRRTRKADPRIERIVEWVVTPFGDALLERELRRRLRAFERAVLREAADRAGEAYARKASLAWQESIEAAVRAAIENRRKP